MGADVSCVPGVAAWAAINAFIEMGADPATADAVYLLGRLETIATGCGYSVDSGLGGRVGCDQLAANSVLILRAVCAHG